MLGTEAAPKKCSSHSRNVIILFMVGFQLVIEKTMPEMLKFNLRLYHGVKKKKKLILINSIVNFIPLFLWVSENCAVGIKHSVNI